MLLTKVDIREMLAKRLEQAPLSEIWALAEQVSANDAGAPAAAAVASLKPRPRFTKLDLRGHQLADSADSWSAVYDTETNLMWTRDVLECGDVNWKDAVKAAGNMRLFGKEDWRAPTVKEQISILDYSRSGPAVDTTYFSSYSGWCWTGTVDASAPSDCAWVVGLQGGYVVRNGQTNHGSVRAVRAGQPLELGL